MNLGDRVVILENGIVGIIIHKAKELLRVKAFNVYTVYAEGVYYHVIDEDIKKLS